MFWRDIAADTDAKRVVDHEKASPAGWGIVFLEIVAPLVKADASEI